MEAEFLVNINERIDPNDFKMAFLQEDKILDEILESRMVDIIYDTPDMILTGVIFDFKINSKNNTIHYNYESNKKTLYVKFILDDEDENW